MITYTTATTKKDLLQILKLQKENLEANISSEELAKEGFVTVHHDYELLAKMNRPYPHIIAKENDVVIGYTLVMLKNFAKEIPVLIPMFEQINNLTYREEKLGAVGYFVMGQVCIDKAFRGKGLFQKLYKKMAIEMKSHFKYVVTEVAERNQRSLRAHEKVGFGRALTYKADGEDWIILVWDFI